MTSKEQRKQWEAEQKTLALLRVEEDDLDWSCHIAAIKINSSSINSSINSPFFVVAQALQGYPVNKLHARPWVMR